MDRLMRARVLLAEAAALGVTIEDLVAESSGSADGPSVAPTVAEYVETVGASFSKGTAGTYKSYWRLAVTRFGGRPLTRSVSTTANRLWLMPWSGLDAIDPEPTADRPARTASGRCAPSSPGPSGPVSSSKARPTNLEKPRRLPNRRRALEDDELREVIDAVRTTSQDPDLDLLLIRFHLESGARREGALNLRLRDLDRRRSTVWLREKFGIEREQPISPSLLRALETHSLNPRGDGGR